MQAMITEKLKDRKVAILGFGREGRSTYRLLRAYLPEKELWIFDQNESIMEDPELMQDSGVHLFCGEGFEKGIEKFDLIIKAPGVPARIFPEGMNPEKISSQTSLFLSEYGSQVIGVTGTKGKSTTASLIYHVLSKSGIPCLLLGNIGLPPFEGIPDISPDTRIVMELSSHQLQFITRSPHISILLNIFQEHLDHYASYEEYQLAKMNIAKYQSKEDYFIYSADQPLILSHLSDSSARQQLLPYSLSSCFEQGIFRDGKNVSLRDGGISKSVFPQNIEFHLPGEHNFSNLMAAASACMLAGASAEQISEGILTFKGLEHRIEFVGEYEGIRFYNDSIATIPEACIEAVKTLKEVDTLILGGFDRGIDYSILYPFLEGSGIRNLIFVGNAGKRMMIEMGELASGSVQKIEAGDYEEVVRIAKKVTAKGKICLLSPAASSYDMFKNFEHRGEIFKKNVRG